MMEVWRNADREASSSSRQSSVEGILLCSDLFTSWRADSSEKSRRFVTAVESENVALATIAKAMAYNILFPVPRQHAFFGAASRVIIKLASHKTTTSTHGVHIKYGC